VKLVPGKIGEVRDDNGLISDVSRSDEVVIYSQATQHWCVKAATH